MKPFGAQKGHVVDFLFTLALFCVFAASALMVVVIGANVYRQTVRGMDSNYDSRTSLTYLTEKVRQNDAANAVTIRSVGIVRLWFCRSRRGSGSMKPGFMCTTAICGKFLWRRVYR